MRTKEDIKAILLNEKAGPVDEFVAIKRALVMAQTHPGEEYLENISNALYSSLVEIDLNGPFGESLSDRAATKIFSVSLENTEKQQKSHGENILGKFLAGPRVVCTSDPIATFQKPSGK